MLGAAQAAAGRAAHDLRPLRWEGTRRVFDLDRKKWPELATDRAAWRATLKSGQPHTVRRLFGPNWAKTVNPLCRVERGEEGKKKADEERPQGAAPSEQRGAQAPVHRMPHPPSPGGTTGQFPTPSTRVPIRRPVALTWPVHTFQVRAGDSWGVRRPSLAGSLRARRCHFNSVMHEFDCCRVSS